MINCSVILTVSDGVKRGVNYFFRISQK